MILRVDIAPLMGQVDELIWKPSSLHTGRGMGDQMIFNVGVFIRTLE